MHLLYSGEKPLIDVGFKFLYTTDYIRYFKLCKVFCVIDFIFKLNIGCT